MCFHFFNMLLLGFEAQKVVELRLIRFTWGDQDGGKEAILMVTEKIDAAVEATGTLMSGGSVETVVSRYREHVAANTRRLTEMA